ncbi:MAG: helix-hairpin-helix domain-containing protein [Prevotella sp.]|nr:helix-hairpin-helix domain-containing protein [Prevotella sp.]
MLRTMKWGIDKYFYYPKRDRQVLLVLITLAAMTLLVIYFAGDPSDIKAADGAGTTAAADSMASKAGQPAESLTAREVHLEPFDPNTADTAQLLRLGLAKWQVANIVKYRSHGGVYTSKEDFAQLYRLTVKQFRQLEPYIRIAPEFRPASTLYARNRHTTPYPTSALKAERDSFHRAYVKQEKLNAGETVDLNALDTTVYKKVPGIGSYYSRKIVEYGRRLGGYVSTDQLDEIDHFPTETKVYFDVKPAAIALVRINHYPLDELRHHPYINYMQARAIIEYRREHGRIDDLSVLRLLDEFRESDLQRLQPYVSYD